MSRLASSSAWDPFLAAVGADHEGRSVARAPVAGALLVGLVVGSALGLFFAPETARKRRDALRRRVDRALEEMESETQHD
jgi:hypothetical protein